MIHHPSTRASTPIAPVDRSIIIHRHRARRRPRRRRRESHARARDRMPSSPLVVHAHHHPRRRPPTPPPRASSSSPAIARVHRSSRAHLSESVHRKRRDVPRRSDRADAGDATPTGDGCGLGIYTLGRMERSVCIAKTIEGYFFIDPGQPGRSRAIRAVDWIRAWIRSWVREVGIKSV